MLGLQSNTMSELNASLSANWARHHKLETRDDLSLSMRHRDLFKVISEGIIEIRGVYNRSGKDIIELTSEA